MRTKELELNERALELRVREFEALEAGAAALVSECATMRRRDVWFRVRRGMQMMAQARRLRVCSRSVAAAHVGAPSLVEERELCDVHFAGVAIGASSGRDGATPDGTSG